MKFDFVTFKELFVGLPVDEDLIYHAYEMILLNDKAHNVEHCYFVIRRGIRLAKQMKMPEKEITLTALATLLHDVGCSIDRKNHHTIGAFLARDILMRYNYPKGDIDVVCGAIEKHRASYIGLRKNDIEELTAIADRGPFDFDDYLKRAIQYRLALNVEVSEDMFESIFAHMVDKFGDNGYAWKTYPALGMEIYKDNIEEFKEKVKDRDLTRESFETILTTLQK